MVNKAVGALSEAWLDNRNPESSGRPFGSLSAITAEGRGVSVRVVDSRTIAISFQPYSNGHFRVLVAAPRFDGSGDLLQQLLLARHVPGQGRKPLHQPIVHIESARLSKVFAQPRDGLVSHGQRLL